MMWEEIIVWILILGITFAVVWLLLTATQRLWTIFARSIRRQWTIRPPIDVPTFAPRRPDRMTPPAHNSITLGPPRRMRLDPSMTPQPVRIRRGPSFTVPARNDPLWVEKGWQRRGNTYYGRYYANGRSWKGMIKVPFRGRYEAYIWNPPMRALERHPHGLCFMNRRLDGRYRVHFSDTPISLDHAIANIEQILSEALNGQRR